METHTHTISPRTDLLPECPQQLWLGSKPRNPNQVSLVGVSGPGHWPAGLPRGCEWPKSLACHLLPPRPVSRKLKSHQNLNLGSDVDVGFPGGSSTAVPRCLSLSCYLNFSLSIFWTDIKKMFLFVGYHVIVHVCACQLCPISSYISHFFRVKTFKFLPFFFLNFRENLRWHIWMIC